MLVKRKMSFDFDDFRRHPHWFLSGSQDFHFCSARIWSGFTSSFQQRPSSSSHPPGKLNQLNFTSSSPLIPDIQLIITSLIGQLFYFLVGFLFCRKLVRWNGLILIGKLTPNLNTQHQPSRNQIWFLCWFRRYIILTWVLEWPNQNRLFHLLLHFAIFS